MSSTKTGAPDVGGKEESKKSNENSKESQAEGKSEQPTNQAGHGNAIRQRPVDKLTKNLLATYKGINENYYKRKQERLKAKEESSKTATGSTSKKTSSSVDYEIVKGAHIGENDRYEIIERLGKGSFGQVVSAYDKEEKKKVAIKIIKNKEAFRKQAETEIRLLKILNTFDPNDQWCIVRFLGTFDHNGHTCIIFEHLSLNMYELLKKSCFNGVNLYLIRKFARQILRTLAFLSLPHVDIIHCDLKPENILFRVPNRSAVKVLDFGSSCRRNEQMYVYIQSRFYRSPEVILGLPYDQAIDMWSLGCMLVEMHTGSPLFSGRDEHDQITRFVKLKGLPPQWMLERGRKTHRFFDIITPRVSAESRTKANTKKEKVNTCESDEDSDPGVATKDGKRKKSFREKQPKELKGSTAPTSETFESYHPVKWDDNAPERERRRKAHVQRMEQFRSEESTSSCPMPVEYRLRPRVKKYAREPKVNTSLRAVLRMDEGGPGARPDPSESEKRRTRYQYSLFIDLLERMLDYDPHKRIKPMEALNHPFLQDDHGEYDPGDEVNCSVPISVVSPVEDDARQISEASPSDRAAVYHKYSLSQKVVESEGKRTENQREETVTESGRAFIPRTELSDNESKFDQDLPNVYAVRPKTKAIPRAFSSTNFSQQKDADANMKDFVHDHSSLFGHKVAAKPPQAPQQQRQQHSAPTLPSHFDE